MGRVSESRATSEGPSGSLPPEGEGAVSLGMLRLLPISDCIPGGRPLPDLGPVLDCAGDAVAMALRLLVLAWRGTAEELLVYA